MKAFGKFIADLLNHPLKVSTIALIFVALGLISEGTLFHLWTLKREQWRLRNRYEDTLKNNEALRHKLNQATFSPTFIGRQARDRLDLISEDEIVFIFENDSQLSNEKVAQ
ncbi:MAG: septum formation initiator family protein [Oligoflexia bacterium]|nr:septum formation initiator family protein [Oligoflexia bacterium]